MSFIKDNKGQGALEYLLIIGAAVLIAAIVIAILVNTASTANKDANDATTQVSEDLNSLKKEAGMIE